MPALPRNSPLNGAPVERRQRAEMRCLRLRLRAVLLLLAVGFTLVGALAAAGRDKSTEEQLKAAFLVNFPKYVDWPAEAFATASSPIVIAALGETKVTREIKKVIAGRTVNGREFVLKELDSGEEPGDCHILFVASAEDQRSPNLLSKLKGASILTVGESAGFLEHGGIINLANRDRKIAMEVNLKAAGEARIRISSRLLGVASVVKGNPK